MVNFTSDTKFVIEGVAPGVHFFTVLAVNVFGEGKEDSIYIMGEFNQVCYTTS